MRTGRCFALLLALYTHDISTDSAAQRSMMTKMRYLNLTLLVGLVFCSSQGSSQTAWRPFSYRRPYTIVEDMLNKEAAASDRAGIQAYSEDLIHLLVPDETEIGYINLLSDRLATAERMAREGRGKLIQEEEIVHGFNDLMRRVGAPSSYLANESALHQFRVHAAALSAFPAILSEEHNGSKCNPGEAVFLFHTLLSQNGALSEHLIDEWMELTSQRESANAGFSELNGRSFISLTTVDTNASSLISTYLRHHRHGAIKMFNKVAQALKF